MDQSLLNKEKTDAEVQQYRYKITTKTPVGKGAFATVYQAVNKNNDIFAIKCIPLEKLKKHNTDKFLLELDISLKMKHQNIVKSYEVFKTNKNWYIACEFCDNGTLSNAIKSMSLDCMEREMECRRYLTQLKNALKYLYRNNIVHRDLKPTNILINGKYPYDTLKLADFGFSRYFGSEDQEQNNTEHKDFMMTSFCGTPMYMAPELLGDRKYTNKADLWSFGVIMYEMLYGSNPYNYPTNLNNLLDLMKTKEIVFNNVYTSDCMSLLKSLLEIDVKKRIDWEIFFRHPWFDKNLPSGFSMESLYGSSENVSNLVNDKSPSPKNQQQFTHNEMESFSKATSVEDLPKDSSMQCLPKIISAENLSKNTKKNSSSDKMVNSTYEINANCRVNHNEVSENQVIKCTEIEDYDIINKDELCPCDYNTYKEEEANGFMKILSSSLYNSVYGLFWKKT
jgi:serine/threonine-protein kinase ULK/ATG1